ncbi:MAG TPA: DUF3300 domain-containing protein, partial [Steroidobacteraceae bacterium]|nr:DUF3300 domain-containing protein [Steroidobacteraceae bacterium]
MNPRPRVLAASFSPGVLAVVAVLAIASTRAQLAAAQAAKPTSPPPQSGSAAPAAKSGSAPSTQQQAAKVPADQLDSLVAPIALYPDPLLAQTLAAATYPLEIIQLQQWLKKNPGLKDKALADAVAKQPWDPSVQSMA